MEKDEMATIMEHVVNWGIGYCQTACVKPEWLEDATRMLYALKPNLPGRDSEEEPTDADKELYWDDWKAEVAAGDTKRGFADYVSYRKEVERDEAQERNQHTLFAAVDEADTAFAVLNLSDGINPQARKALGQAWRKIQDARVLMKPQGAYAEAIREIRAEEKAEVEKLRDLVSQAFERFTDNDMQPPNHELSRWLKDAGTMLAERKEQEL
jgi:hypothetical protein